MILLLVIGIKVMREDGGEVRVEYMRYFYTVAFKSSFSNALFNGNFYLECSRL